MEELIAFLSVIQMCIVFCLIDKNNELKEKAEAYNNALKTAGKIRGNCNKEDSEVKDAMEVLFPELKNR